MARTSSSVGGMTGRPSVHPIASRRSLARAKFASISTRCDVGIRLRMGP
jgi:hypothetical protein